MKSCVFQTKSRWVQNMDLKFLRFCQTMKFLLDLPQEILEAENADSVKLLTAPLILACQPSEKWADQLDTEDQIGYWLAFNRDFYWMAQCWVSGSTTKTLSPLLKAGLISRNKYNILRYSQEMFKQLWELCQEVEPFIREAFEKAKLKYPIPGANSLFAKIVEEMVDAEIGTTLTYVECSRPKREKALRLQAKTYKGEQLKVDERKFIKATLHSQYRETPATQLFFDAARAAAREDKFIKKKLAYYHEVWAGLLECYATEWHNKGSHIWKKGNRLPFRKP